MDRPQETLINYHEKLAKLFANFVYRELSKLRYPTTYQKRRWPYELIQNARDTLNHPHATVEITFDFQTKNVVFEHNGPPFDETDLSNVCLHGSDKTAAEQKKIGQFGSGLLSTHILSHQVRLESILQLDHQRYWLDLPLVVSEDHQTLTTLLDERLQKVEMTRHYPCPPHTPPMTRFTYQQLSPEQQTVAQEGKEHLLKHIPYILLFNYGITQVTVKDLADTIVFSRGDGTNIIRVSQKEGESTLYFAMESTPDLELIIPLNKESDRFCLAPLADLSRLFCAYPLVGTDQFSFPAVLNSEYFQPEENRLTVALPSSPQTDTPNQQILHKAITAFTKIFIRLQNQYGISDLTPLLASLSSDSSEPIQQEIRAKLVTCLQNIPFLQSKSGLPLAPQDTYFPLPSLPTEERKLINDFLGFYTPDHTVDFDTLNKLSLFWGKLNNNKKVSREGIITCLEKFSSLTKTLTTLPLEEFEYRQLFGRLVSFLSPEQARQKRIWPNRQGEFKNYQEIYLNTDIPSEVLDIFATNAHPTLNLNPVLLRTGYEDYFPLFCHAPKSKTWINYFENIWKQIAQFLEQENIPNEDRPWLKQFILLFEQNQTLFTSVQSTAAYPLLENAIPKLKILHTGRVIINKLMGLPKEAMDRVLISADQEQEQILRQKEGEKWEKQVMKRFAALGFDCQKRPQGGDLLLTHPAAPGWQYILEIKSTTQTSVALTVNQYREALQSKNSFGLGVYDKEQNTFFYLPQISEKLAAFHNDWQSFWELWPATLSSVNAPIFQPQEPSSEKIYVNFRHPQHEKLDEQAFINYLRQIMYQ